MQDFKKSLVVRIREKISETQKWNEPLPTAFLLLAAMMLILPFDINQLVFMGCGAIFYIILYEFQPWMVTDSSSYLSRKVAEAGIGCKAVGRSVATAGNLKSTNQSRSEARLRHAGAHPRHETRTPTLKPIPRLEFKNVGWEGEVVELLGNIAPTDESRAVVDRIAENVRASIYHFYPGVEVVGFAAGDCRRGKAFGVAVPEVDIVINIKPQVLLRRFMGRNCCLDSGNHVDLSKVQKAALRECTETLVSNHNFKFRRSAFRCSEPKVTFLARYSSGEECVAIDVSVNATVPMYNMALLTECGLMEFRTRELILLIRRWAKDRGICHSAKGYFSPYHWSILAIFFLQVGVDEEGPLLPPLEQFELSLCVKGKPVPVGQQARWSPAPFDGQRKSTASLFKDFVRFYAEEFACQNEIVSIRLGQRSAHSVAMPLHMVHADEEGVKPEVAISVEDPFMPERNLGDCLSSISLRRTRQELQRAHELCSRDASLKELLELWAPPEAAVEPFDKKCGH
eukprot:TRINITY_DN2592_c0_g1_i1.p1 TRINITY_DN2592_c0_g1~~TRINITY_DN2592_c0_g1_i1.p1  ORF type:complete len:512 (+),score=89.99 TRINITY_DN2592_c0_g1_i1:104-1639(+)